jgi:hypothetical protein
VGLGEAEITHKPWEVSVDTSFTTFGWVPLTLVPDRAKLIELHEFFCESVFCRD